MCGITGIFDSNSINNNSKIIREMTNKLNHRGPNSKSIWHNQEKGIFLGHTRLSIIDLSNLGSQPMISNNKRWVISYNGEIYNYKKLKNELTNQNINLKGNSDTEVLLETFSFFGIDETLKKIIGMFSIALWDNQENCLYLIRDRLGIKPLYWGKINNSYIFASELKSIECHPNFNFVFNNAAMHKYFKHMYVPTPLTIYKNIFKLDPGCYLKIKNNQEKKNKYWDINNFNKNDNLLNYNNKGSAIHEIHDLIKKSINIRMISDVPLGSMLSGGIDSSLVTSIMQTLSSKPIKTFSIGFYNNNFNEAKYAKEIANYLKTDHTELYLDDNDVKNNIEKVLNVHDEPFSDSSQIPTYFISELTKNSVTVALTGDGGDEIFAGYNRYLWANKINKFNSNLPLLIRKFLKNLFLSAPNIFLDKLSPGNAIHSNLSDKIRKLSDLIILNNKKDIYDYLISNFYKDNILKKELINQIELDDISNYDQYFLNNFNGSIKDMQKIDTLTYLPDDILTKVDRATMSFGLEARVPLLDHRLVEYVSRIDSSLLINKGISKFHLKKILSEYIPEKLFNRKKMGFAAPISNWLKGPLKFLGDELIMSDKNQIDLFLDKKKIRNMWVNFINGNNKSHSKLWSIIIFQYWINQRHNTNV